MSNSAWVIIEGEPFLGKALAYKESVFNSRRALFSCCMGDGKAGEETGGVTQ